MFVFSKVVRTISKGLLFVLVYGLAFSGITNVLKLFYKSSLSTQEEGFFIRSL